MLFDDVSGRGVTVGLGEALAAAAVCLDAVASARDGAASTRQGSKESSPECVGGERARLVAATTHLALQARRLATEWAPAGEVSVDPGGVGCGGWAVGSHRDLPAIAAAVVEVSDAALRDAGNNAGARVLLQVAAARDLARGIVEVGRSELRSIGRVGPEEGSSSDHRVDADPGQRLRRAGLAAGRADHSVRAAS